MGGAGLQSAGAMSAVAREGCKVQAGVHVSPLKMSVSRLQYAWHNFVVAVAGVHCDFKVIALVKAERHIQMGQ
jgi:hypothetical protein